MTSGPTDTSQDPPAGVVDTDDAGAVGPSTSTGDDPTTDQGHHQEDAMASSTRKNTARDAGDDTDASVTDSAQTLEEVAPGVATRTHPSVAAVLPDPLFASELQVVQAPPMFWMVDGGGEFHAAGDYETFQRLRAAGCKVSDTAPEGAPAATGGVVI